MKKPFVVTLTVVSEHVFNVEEANTPEEAISIAEVMFEEGEMGNDTIVDMDADAYPVEEA